MRNPRIEPCVGDVWRFQGANQSVVSVEGRWVGLQVEGVADQYTLYEGVPAEAIFLGGDGVVGDNDGREQAPLRYSVGRDRETIDRIRDALYWTWPDDREVAFQGFCFGQFLRYTDRAGLKEGQPTERDAASAQWYMAMLRHVRGDGPDPRESRGADFVPYARAPSQLFD